ncbi:MAG TPA: AAC(3) family N-acetyltransferase [Candidatus Bathyarchaeota archaeon]|nr:AAC(3) family N-acetyltransferase [Candidatus Bathyarchaeota archaeon]
MSNKRNLVQSARQVVSKEQIVADLRRMGIQKGDRVAVTLSLKSIGYIKGGPDEFIDALLEVVGSNGTIMMNTFTYYFPLSSVPKDYVFDCESTPSYTGLVPETFRKRTDVFRSRHPTCSVAVIGKQAEYLTEEHDEKSDPLLPYSRLAKIDGKYLCIGIGDRLVAIRHEAQCRAGLSDAVPLYYAVHYKTDQGKVKLFVRKYFGCIRNLPRLVPDLRKMGVLKTGRIGGAQAYVASARELIDSMSEMLKENPTLNLCEKVTCLWCRELERRMKLFNKIENPKFFQKNNSVIKVVALVNSVRLRRFNLLLFRKGEKEVMGDDKQKYLPLQMLFGFINDLCLTVREKVHCWSK